MGGFYDGNADKMNVLQTYLDRIATAAELPSGSVTIRLRGSDKISITKESLYLLAPTKNSTRDPYYYITTSKNGYPKIIAIFALEQLPGCCAFCLSHGAYVYENYRRMGIGRILNQLRQWIATEAGYTAMLCTDIIYNEAQRKILKSEGFVDIYNLINKRTGNDVALSVKML